MISPFRLCFNDWPYGGFAIFENFLDLYFVIDIILSFNTGFYECGYLIMDRKQIVSTYIRFWFWLDLVGSFPYVLVISPSIYFDIWLTSEKFRLSPENSTNLMVSS